MNLHASEATLIHTYTHTHLSQNANMLRAAGFKAHTAGCIDYFTCNLASQEQRPSLAPVLLLHGVGCGLLPYTPLLTSVAATGVLCVV